MEVLVMIGILGLIGTIATQVFFTTFRSSNKSRVSENLKQKGQFALNVIEKMVRGATSLPNLGTICSGDDRNNLAIVSRDGFTTTFACDSAQITSSSAQLGTIVLLDDITQIDCSHFINCYLGGGGRPEVTVDFGLTSGSTSSLPHEQSSIRFRTQVTPRNY